MSLENANIHRDPQTSDSRRHSRSCREQSFFKISSLYNVRWRFDWTDARKNELKSHLLHTNNADTFPVLSSSQNPILQPQKTVLRYSLTHPLFTMHSLHCSTFVIILISSFCSTSSFHFLCHTIFFRDRTTEQ